MVDHEQSSASSKGEDDEHNNGLSSNTTASSDAISGNKDGIRGTLSAKNSNLVSSTLRGRASILDGRSGRSSSRDTDGSVGGQWAPGSIAAPSWPAPVSLNSGQHSGRISPVVPEDADLSSSLADGSLRASPAGGISVQVVLSRWARPAHLVNGIPALSDDTVIRGSILRGVSLSSSAIRPHNINTRGVGESNSRNPRSEVDSGSVLEVNNKVPGSNNPISVGIKSNRTGGSVEGSLDNLSKESLWIIRDRTSLSQSSVEDGLEPPIGSVGVGHHDIVSVWSVRSWVARIVGGDSGASIRGGSVVVDISPPVNEVSRSIGVGRANSSGRKGGWLRSPEGSVSRPLGGGLISSWGESNDSLNKELSLIRGNSLGIKGVNQVGVHDSISTNPSVSWSSKTNRVSLVNKGSSIRSLADNNNDPGLGLLDGGQLRNNGGGIPGEDLVGQHSLGRKLGSINEGLGSASSVRGGIGHDSHLNPSVLLSHLRKTNGLEGIRGWKTEEEWVGLSIRQSWGGSRVRGLWDLVGLEGQGSVHGRSRRGRSADNLGSPLRDSNSSKESLSGISLRLLNLELELVVWQERGVGVELVHGHDESVQTSDSGGIHRRLEHWEKTSNLDGVGLLGIGNECCAENAKQKCDAAQHGGSARHDYLFTLAKSRRVRAPRSNFLYQLGQLALTFGDVRHRRTGQFPKKSRANHADRNQTPGTRRMDQSNFYWRNLGIERY